MKTCRSCLSDTFDNINLFETLFEQRNGAELKEIEVSTIFHQCTNIELNKNDRMPKYICLKCLEKLVGAYEFVLNCKQTDLKLKEIVDFNRVDIVQSLESNSIETYSDRYSESSSAESEDDEYDTSRDIDLKNVANTSVDEDSQTKCEHICLKCYKTFDSSAKLKKHQRIHTGKWNCPECDRVMANKHSLRFHMILHTGKPHECTVCEKRFVSVYELRRHIKIYHKNGKSHECDMCPKRYYTFNQLKNHKLTHKKQIRQASEFEDDPEPTLAGDTKLNIQVEDDQIVSSPIHATESINIDELKIEVIDNSDPWAEENPREIECSAINTIKTEEKDRLSADREKALLNDDDDDDPQSDSANDYNTSDEDSTDSKKAFYRCKNCFKKFRLKSNYVSHLKLKLNCKADLNQKTNPQKCQHCSTICDNVYQLRKHLEFHLDKDPFKCPICSKIYKSWMKLAGHKRQVHSSKTVTRKPHLCTLCGKGFSSSKLLDDHYMVHQGVRNYKCDQCERSFCTIYGLKQHLTIHTRDALQCSECGKILANKMSLKNHMTIHFGKGHACNLCDKKYPDTATLNRHLKVHRGERNYACDQCGKRYYRGGDLNDHIRKIHENPMDFKCEVCGTGFGHRRALKKHVRLVHIGKKIYKCDMCGKTYDRKSRLKDHEKKCHALPASSNQTSTSIITTTSAQSESSENIAIPLTNYTQINGIQLVGLFQNIQ